MYKKSQTTFTVVCDFLILPPQYQTIFITLRVFKNK